jgi:hypothetical protein
LVGIKKSNQSPMTENKQAKFEDSNIAKLGSDEDLAQRVAAAKTEKEWKGAGEKVGIQVKTEFKF